MTSAELPPLLRVRDLRHPGARQQARRHLRLWGRRYYAGVHALGAGHVALVFGSGGERWRPSWGGARLRWILLGLRRGSGGAA